MSRLALALAVSAVLLAPAVGGSRAFAAEKSEGLKPTGAKKRVAVFKFEDKTDHTWRWWSGKGVGDGMADMLVTSLVKSGRYRVFERQEIEAALGEQRLGTAGVVTQESAAKAGKMLGAEYAIIGSVTEFGWKKRSTGGLLKAAGVGGGLSQTSAVVGIDVRFVNTTTGEIEKAETVRKQKSSMGVGVNTSQVTFASQDKFDESIVGKATREAIDDITTLLDGMSGGGGGWSAKIVTVAGGNCIINAGSESGLKPGQHFLVFRAGEELKDPDTGESLGAEETQVGEIEVTSDFGGKGKASNCRVVSGSLQKGDSVREKGAKK